MLVWLIYASACSSLDLYYMGFSVLPGLECFISHVRENFGYNIFKHFLRPFVFLWWDPYNVNVGAFNVVPEVFGSVLISSHSLFFIPWQWFPALCLLAYLSSPLPQLFCNWFLLGQFFISVIVCFISIFFNLLTLG